MEKINFVNTIKSFFLGLFLGVILLFYDGGEQLFKYKVMTVLASGSIGFLIGFITEWLTSVLPIKLAKARTYFFINNLIALCVAALVLCSLALIAGGKPADIGEFFPVMLIVLGIICIANLFDYLMYRRAQNKLKSFKSSLKDS